MGKFDDFIDQFTASFDADSFDAAQFKAAAQTVYAEDLALRDAKISQLEETAAQTAKELRDRKADLFDQLMNTGPKTTSIPTTNPTGVEPNPDDVDISAMFLTK